MKKNRKTYPKHLERPRCPWCGKILDLEEITTRKKGVFKTKCCSQYVVEKLGTWEFYLTVIAMFTIIVWIIIAGFEAGPHVFAISGIPFIVFCILYANSLPFFRIKMGLPKNKDKVEERVLGYANIRWYSLLEGGIGLPRLRIINNMIFPVCFVNKEGIPVSHTVCVRLQKRYLLLWKKAKVRLITEDLWKEDTEGKVPWDKAEKFLIYNYGVVIGEGKLIEKLF